MRARSPVLPILTLAIRNEADVVLVRQRVRIVADLLGFTIVDQTRIATAVSEIARNALTHGGGGTARFAAGGHPAALHIVVEDVGEGLARAAGGATGRAAPAEDRPDARARGGTGLQLSRRLMDSLEIEARPTGTAIVMTKYLPGPVREVRPEEVRTVVDELMTRPPESLLEELYQQHQELLAVLDDLNRQQESLRAANNELEETNRGVMALYSEVTRELDDTNRGVVALYSQLDEQTEELRRVNALKDRFLSHLSHEFRTPLNSTLALSRLLMERIDGPLTSEQAVQVDFIRKGAEDLLGMVNDLLDIAKIEAGRMELRIEEFLVEDLIAGLRGMFRPLAAEAHLDLGIEDPPRDMPPMRTDRGKLNQILRNLIANALQHTTRGSVSVDVSEQDGQVAFTVRDTGTGIAAADMERIFEDFGQVRVGRSSASRGTGLGLPIARELTRLLGGELSAESRLGHGSEFRVRIPRRLAIADGVVVTPRTKPAEASAPVELTRPPVVTPRSSGEREDADEPTVLVIDDDAASRYVVEHTLGPSGCRVVHAETGAAGLAAALSHRPRAIFLDLGLPDASGFDLLQSLKGVPDLADCPVIIYTCRELDSSQSRSLSGFALRIVHKSDPALLTSIASIGDALVGVTRRGGGEEER